MFFFFNDTATTEIYTLSLHDALPISSAGGRGAGYEAARDLRARCLRSSWLSSGWSPGRWSVSSTKCRSEEHTSELQSHLNLVCRLLLEKKKTSLQERMPLL